jgi:alpha-beta hydrolase superfamily lysophospholipase
LTPSLLLTGFKEEYLHCQRKERIPFTLWGQSIGAGVATALLAHHSDEMKSEKAIEGLILETLFLSVKSMLVALYPQRWLPYRYLWPLLRNLLGTGPPDPWELRCLLRIGSTIYLVRRPLCYSRSSRCLAEFSSSFSSSCSIF